MLKIKVNDYIRTKKGSIAKICAYQDLKTYDENNIGVTFHSFDTDKGTIADIEVLKHSSNIIDLIEVGDYVNGYRIYGINNIKDSTNKAFTVFLKNNNKVLRFWNKDDIKSIVTKEMFKSVEYRMETN